MSSLSERSGSAHRLDVAFLHRAPVLVTPVRDHVHMQERSGDGAVVVSPTAEASSGVSVPGSSMTSRAMSSCVTPICVTRSASLGGTRTHRS
jgi:hypothetical protein